MNPHLLAVDWGSSSLRGALLDAQGQVLDECQASAGLLNVPADGWAAAFDRHFGAWMARWPHLRCLMAGMVGSRQGWVEAPYVACPARLQDLAAQLHWVQPGRVAIVPGLRCAHARSEATPDAIPDAIPDVMRGEETQVFGALALLGLQDADDVRLVLPGTHSKWVQVRAGRLQQFSTHMTGECFALLRHQSLLARTLPATDGPLHEAGFDAGVARAQQAGGLLHHLFGVRAQGLLAHHGGAYLESYLSGLVIGEELRAQAPPLGSRVVLIGSDALRVRYQRALGSLCVDAKPVGNGACWRGLLALAATIAP